jgi:hypothetical protein
VRPIPPVTPRLHHIADRVEHVPHLARPLQRVAFIRVRYKSRNSHFASETSLGYDFRVVAIPVT